MYQKKRNGESMRNNAKTFFGVNLSILVFVTWLLGACSGDKPEIQAVSEEEAAEINAIGNQAAGLLMKTLQHELLSAIQHSGVPGAIDVCRLRALKLTDSLATVINRVEKIKRTSSKIRNPRNKADRYEEEALAYFSERSPAVFSDTYIQKLTDEKGTVYRFYKPMQVKPLCLTCHGRSESFGAELAERLKKAYPQDQATGYQADDFRGVISIAIR